MRLVLIDESAGKVKTKKERAIIAEAWKKANMKVDGVSEVDRIAAGLDGAGGAGGTDGCGSGDDSKGSHGGTDKGKKVFEKSKLPAKDKKSANGKLAKKKSGKPIKKSTGKANK